MLDKATDQRKRVDRLLRKMAGIQMLDPSQLVNLQVELRQLQSSFSKQVVNMLHALQSTYAMIII